MSAKTPFQGIRDANQAMTAATASSSITINTGCESVRVVNTDSTNFCHIRIGKGAQTCTTSDSVVLPGESIVFHKDNDDDTVAALRNTGDSIIHVQPGSGGI